MCFLSQKDTWRIGGFQRPEWVASSSFPGTGCSAASESKEKKKQDSGTRGKRWIVGRKLFTCVAKRGEGEGEGKRLDYVGLNAHEGREGNVHGICACVPGRVSVRSPSYSQWV